MAADEPRVGVAEIRDGLLMATHALRDIAPALGGTADDLPGALTALDGHLELAMTPLAVLGAEGHGKSTLVDVIVGQDVVPREEQVPATVAPVLLCWGPTAGPEFFVARKDSEDLISCDSRTAFRRLLLQRYNPDNREGVLFGVVRWAHDVLGHGLTLLDLPGLAGVSDEVRVRTEETIADLRRGVVVVRDREYGPAVRTLERWGNGLTVEAVISNWTLDFWTGDVDAKVERQAQIIVDQLDADAAQVFVLHLPTLAPWTPDEQRVHHPRHEAEAERFRAWLRRVMGDDTARRLLREWAGSIRAPLDVVADRVADHVRLLGLPSDQRSARAEARRVQAKKELELRYATLRKDVEFGQLVRQAWDELSERSQRTRSALIGSAARAEKARRGLGWLDATTDVTSPIIAPVTAALADVSAVEKEFSDIAERLMGEWRQRVTPLLWRVTTEHLPFLPRPLEGVRVEGDGLVDVDPAPARDTVGAVLDERRRIDRVVATARDAARQLDVTADGPARRAFDSVVNAIKDAFFVAACGQIDAAAAALVAADEDVRAVIMQATELLDDIRTRTDAALALEVPGMPPSAPQRGEGAVPQARAPERDRALRK